MGGGGGELLISSSDFINFTLLLVFIQFFRACLDIFSNIVFFFPLCLLGFSRMLAALLKIPHLSILMIIMSLFMTMIIKRNSNFMMIPP